MSNSKNLTNFTPIDKPTTPLAATMTGVRLPQHIHDKVASGFASGYEKSAWLREVIEAAAIARWPELMVIAVTTQPDPEVAASKFSLTISNMPARDKRGWVRLQETFLKPDKQSSHGSSAQQLTFYLEDGIYEVQDANFGGRKTNHYWLKVANGEGIEIEMPKPDLGIELPQLQGSVPQVSWAEKIRAKAIKDCLPNIPESHRQLAQVCLESFDNNASGWWIDNLKFGFLDSKLLTWVKSQLKEKMIEEYPNKKWENHEPNEYSHEVSGGRYIFSLSKFGEVWKGKGDSLRNVTIFCKNPESHAWEVWHYEQKSTDFGWH